MIFSIYFLNSLNCLSSFYLIKYNRSNYLIIQQIIEIVPIKDILIYIDYS